MPTRSNAEIIRLVERACEHEAVDVHRQARKRVAGLNTVAVVAPMFGMLATVSSFLNAFKGESGRLGRAEFFAAEFAVALIPITLSLLVAIIAYGSYHYFAARVHAFDIDMANGSSELVDCVSRLQLLSSHAQATRLQYSDHGS